MKNLDSDPVNIDGSFMTVNHNRNTEIFKYAIMTILVYFAFIALLLPVVGGHPWGLLCFSKKFALSNQTPVPERFLSSKSGYDGQFYYFLALSPFVKNPSSLGYHFDNQAIRQQRILYPIIIHLLAWGNPGLTAWCMIVLNIMATGGIVIFTGKILHRMGRPLWLSLLAGFYPGLAVSVPRGLTEPLCLVWVFAALSVWERRPLLAACLLSLAVLTRETALLVAAGFGCAWGLGMIKKIPQTFPPCMWELPLGAYLLWQGFLHCRITGGSISEAASTHIEWPLVGLFQAIRALLSPDIKTLYFLFFIGMVIVWQFCVAKTLNFKHYPLFWGWVLYGVLLSVTGVDIWDNSPGLLRVASEWNLIGLLLVAGSRFYRWKPVVVVWISAWLLSAAAEWHSYRHLLQ